MNYNWRIQKCRASAPLTWHPVWCKFIENPRTTVFITNYKCNFNNKVSLWHLISVKRSYFLNTDSVDKYNVLKRHFKPRRDNEPHFVTDRFSALFLNNEKFFTFGNN